MKNIAKILVSLILAAALLFAACKDKDDDEGEETISVSGATVYYENENGTYTALSGVNVTVDVWIGSNKLEMEEEAGSITNGKLSFKLPDISDLIKYGSTFAEMFASNSYTTTTSTPAVSPSNAKMFFAGIGGEIVFDSDREWFRLYYGNENVRAEYIYLDKSATVKGTWTQVYSYNGVSETNSITFDCTLNKGWNTVYVSESGNTETYTTSKPTGTLRWIMEM